MDLDWVSLFLINRSVGLRGGRSCTRVKIHCVSGIGVSIHATVFLLDEATRFRSRLARAVPVAPFAPQIGHVGLGTTAMPKVM